MYRTRLSLSLAVGSAVSLPRARIWESESLKSVVIVLSRRREIGKVASLWILPINRGSLASHSATVLAFLSMVPGSTLFQLPECPGR